MIIVTQKLSRVNKRFVKLSVEDFKMRIDENVLDEKR